MRGTLRRDACFHHVQLAPCWETRNAVWRPEWSAASLNAPTSRTLRRRRGCRPDSGSESDRLGLYKFRSRLTLLSAPRKLIWTSSRQGKWGSAVQFGRGPATVFGFNAESQATLPRRRGWAYFARGYASCSIPASRRVFYFLISHGNFVRGDSCNTVSPMPSVAPAFSPLRHFCSPACPSAPSPPRRRLHLPRRRQCAKLSTRPAAPFASRYSPHASSPSRPA